MTQSICYGASPQILYVMVRLILGVGQMFRSAKSAITNRYGKEFTDLIRTESSNSLADQFFTLHLLFA